MQHRSDEKDIILAIQAMERDPELSARGAARLYSVDHTTLCRRRRGRLSRRDSVPKSRKLTDLEESTIVQYVLDLDSRAFPPNLARVGDMANQLLRDRDASPVGKRWATNFVKRQPELRTRLNRRYDYQRAQCEDPDAINAWFRLIRNIIAKYGVQEADIYNFDETGFMIGIISTGMVVTSAERRGRPKIAQQGNREWITVIQGVNSQGWAIPPFIIVAGKFHLSSWYEDSQLPED